MNPTRAMREPIGLRGARVLFLALWIVIACFPLAWAAIMSAKLPVDAFSSNPLEVVLGPRTLAAAGGWSVLDAGLGLLLLWGAYQAGAAIAAPLARALSLAGSAAVGWLVTALLLAVAGVVVVAWLLPMLLTAVDGALRSVPGLERLAEPVLGITAQHYVSVWVKHGFVHNFANSMIVTTGVVAISLTVGTLAG